MKVVGLFAGVGGLEEGLRQAGHETIFTCENWEPAQAVLKAHLPDIPNHSDVRTLMGFPEDTELVCGGFPCQDLSQAGRTAGIEGLRSSLVGEVFRLLDSHPVPWVLLENVSFMLHLGRGSAMELVVRAFEERGYRWAYRVVNSLAFLPQRRERVFFVASQEGSPETILLADDAPPRPRRTTLETHAHGFYWTEGTRGLGWAPDAVPTLKNGSTIGIPSPPAILMPDGSVIQPDIRDAERLQGFSEDWTEAAGAVGRASFRWALVGNAVTVPVAKWIGQRFTNPSEYNTTLDRPMPEGGRWPSAARWDGETRKAVAIGPFPVWRRRPPLTKFLKHPGKLLSIRATAGFLSRAEASSLQLITDQFRAKIRAHLISMGGVSPPELLAAE